MTDDSKQPDRILTSAEEQAVRRQLAAVRHTGPMPVEIAGRLDDVIADLQAERAERAEPTEAPASNVVPLASRRRLRIAQGFVAAAAVVAVGVGITQVLSNSGSDDAGEAGVSAENDDRSGIDSGAPTDGSSATMSSPGAAPREGDEARYAEAPKVGSKSFQRDVVYLSTMELGDPGDPAGGTPTGTPEDVPQVIPGLQRMTRTCALTAPPEGYDARPVLYDGRRAILAYGTITDGRQRVDLYLCSTGTHERSVTIQLP